MCGEAGNMVLCSLVLTFTGFDWSMFINYYRGLVLAWLGCFRNKLAGQVAISDSWNKNQKEKKTTPLRIRDEAGLLCPRVTAASILCKRGVASSALGPAQHTKYIFAFKQWISPFALFASEPDWKWMLWCCVNLMKRFDWLYCLFAS